MSKSSSPVTIQSDLLAMAAWTNLSSSMSREYVSLCSCTGISTQFAEEPTS
jgi:hypothetical protein